jgi:hypothetical protein
VLAPAPAHARPIDGFFAMTDNGHEDELVSMTKAIMFSNHGQAISDEQAAGIIALVLGGRQVANPGAYLRQALAQPDGGRYGPPASSAPTAQPPEVDLITMRKAALLRDGESAADAGARAERAHRGADLARKMLAERPRPLTERGELGGELHGPALAAEQAAESRAHRDRLPMIQDVLLPDDDPDPEPDPADDEPDVDEDDDDDDDGEEFEPPF